MGKHAVWKSDVKNTNTAKHFILFYTDTKLILFLENNILYKFTSVEFTIGSIWWDSTCIFKKKKLSTNSPLWLKMVKT